MPAGPKRNSLWRLVEALQKVIGGGVCKQVTVVVYFDAHGNMMGRSQMKVRKLYPHNFFEAMAKALEEADDE